MYVSMTVGIYSSLHRLQFEWFSMSRKRQLDKCVLNLIKSWNQNADNSLGLLGSTPALDRLNICWQKSLKQNRNIQLDLCLIKSAVSLKNLRLESLESVYIYIYWNQQDCDLCTCITIVGRFKTYKELWICHIYIDLFQ